MQVRCLPAGFHIRWVQLESSKLEPLNVPGWLQRDGATSCVSVIDFYPYWHSSLCSPLQGADVIGAAARTQIATRRLHRAPERLRRRPRLFIPPERRHPCCHNSVHNGGIILPLARSDGSDGSRKSVCTRTTRSLYPSLPDRRV